MSLIAGLISIGSVLFGGSTSASKSNSFVQESIKAVGTYIDEKNLTEEERVKYHLQAGTTHLELIKATANENSVRSITRRYLAWSIVGVALINAQIAIILAWFGKDELVDKMLEIAEAYYIGWAFGAVVVFYFGVQFMRGKK